MLDEKIKIRCRRCNYSFFAVLNINVLICPNCRKPIENIEIVEPNSYLENLNSQESSGNAGNLEGLEVEPGEKQKLNKNIAMCLGFYVFMVFAFFTDGVASGIVGICLFAPITYFLYWFGKPEVSRGTGTAINVSDYNSLYSLLNTTPTEFEILTGEILQKNGIMSTYQRVGGAGDLAADLVGSSPSGHKVVVQCKRYAPGNKIGTPQLQMFIGMIRVHHKADHGFFVTSSTYTNQALELAREHADIVTLIDGDGLSELLRRIS